MEAVKTNPQLQKYPAYKDSGVEWLGEIPEHWEVRRLAVLGKFSASGIDKLIKKNESLVKIINYTDVYKNEKRFVDTSFNYMVVSTKEGNRRKNLVKKGDLIFLPSSETLEDLGLAALVNEELENVSFSYHVLRFEFEKEIDHNFKKYITNNPTVLNHFSRQGTGSIRKTLGRNDFRNTKVLLPPYSEQTAIANFLDVKCNNIETAIEQKQQLIELLNERKQIIVQVAVTKGLNPDVKMKVSGVEWIGEIPAHWEVKKGKFMFYEINERSLTGEEELLSVSHMTGVTPRSEKNVNMFLSEDYAGSKICHPGDLVFNIMWTWMGALGVSKFSGIVSPSYSVLRQKTQETFNSIYLELLLKSTKYVEYYNQVSTGLHSSRLRFYSHMFLNMKLGFPSKLEQDEIVQNIELQTSKINRSIAFQQQQIEKLKEYKSSLIDAAVTGKIKVS